MVTAVFDSSGILFTTGKELPTKLGSSFAACTLAKEVAITVDKKLIKL